MTWDEWLQQDYARYKNEVNAGNPAPQQIGAPIGQGQYYEPAPPPPQQYSVSDPNYAAPQQTAPIGQGQYYEPVYHQPHTPPPTAYPTLQPAGYRPPDAYEPTPVIGPGNAYSGMTASQADAAYAENVPSWTVPFGMATAREQASAPTPAEVHSEVGQLRHDDYLSGQGIYETPFVIGRQAFGGGVEPQYLPNQRTNNAAFSPAEAAYERQLTERATQQLQDRAANPETFGDLVPGVIKDNPVVGGLGRVKDAIPGLPVVGGLGAAKDAFDERTGVVSGISDAATGLATGIINLADSKRREVVTTVGQRAIDRVVAGNPDKTFGATDPGVVFADTFSGFAPLDQTFERWVDDPANDAIIRQVADQGFNGLTGGEALYEYFKSQQGLGAGLISDVMHDPFTAGELALSGGAALGAKTAIGVGKIVGKEAAGQAVAGAIRRGKDVLNVAFDPLTAPSVIGREVIDPVARTSLKLTKGAAAADAYTPIGQRVGGAIENVYVSKVLSEGGQRARALNHAEDAAAILDTAATAETAVTPDAWLFERDAAGNVLTQNTPWGGPRPLVRDRVTGIVRPVTEADFDEALPIMMRLPHDRATRIAGGRTPYQQMADDWMHLATNARAIGMSRLIDTRYPSRGPLYAKGVDFTARRFQRFGQEAIDAEYQAARTKFARSQGELARLQAIPAAHRPATHATQLRSAKQRVAGAAYDLDHIEAALMIAGRRDAKAALRAPHLRQWRQIATQNGYRQSNRDFARLVSGATLPPGTPGTPARLTFTDLAGTLDDETRTIGSQRLSTGVNVGDAVLEIRADLNRFQDLARQFVEAQRTGAAFDPWDAQELDALATRYRHLFPLKKSQPFTAEYAAGRVAQWTDAALSQAVAGSARRTIGIDRGFIDAATGLMKPTGIAAWNASDGMLKQGIGKLIRGLDWAGTQYRKVQLYNPLNILRYSGLQFAGNAVTLGIGETGALVDYFKAIPHILARDFAGVAGAQTSLDAMTRTAGLGTSPFVRNTFKDEIANAAFGNGGNLVQRYFRGARSFAGAFDTALREAAYMHRFAPRYRAMQFALRKSAVQRAATMMPAGTVSPDAIDAAFANLDALHPQQGRAFNAAELKAALIDASGAPGNSTVQTWADRVARDYQNGLRQLHKDSIKNVDRLGFSFNETNADKLLSRVFMYHYWSSRANMLYTREMLGNPALLNGYVSMWRGLDAEAAKTDAPPWLRGFYEFMQTPMGLTVFGNPTALLNTFAIFNPETLGEGYLTNLTLAGQGVERSPFMVHPVIHLLAHASGALGSGAQAPNLNPISGTKLYDWLTAWNTNADTPFWKDEAGNPVPPPYALRSLGGIPAAQFIAEKLSPVIAPILNSAGIPADLMQFGDLAATQSQDLRYLMLDIVRADNPGLSDAELMDVLVEQHGGGFNTADPVYQQALDIYAERATAGMLEGRDLSVGGIDFGGVVRGIVDLASPFQRQVRVASRDATDAQIEGYYSAKEDYGTRDDILAGDIEEPIRIGGFGVQPPSLFTEVELGGRVITPAELAAMPKDERARIADEWFTARNPDAPLDPEQLVYPEDADRMQRIARAADPADLKLQEADAHLWTVGTPQENEARAFADGLAKGQLPAGTDNVTVTMLDGQKQTFDQNDLDAMTDAERSDLRYLWLANEGKREGYEAFYEKQDQLIADNPDLGGLEQMKRIASEYAGGPVEWVRATIQDNPGYAEYANRLDPVRYPEGSEDWAKKMTSLEAFQTLEQQRYQSGAPYAWEQVAGAPVVPGMSGAASLNEAYTTAEAAREVKTPRGEYIEQGLSRLEEVKAAADAYDTSAGYAPGTSWNRLMQRTLTGDTTNRDYFVDEALYDQLNDQFSGVSDTGQEYGPLPGKDSQLREYLVWASQQPPDQRDPWVWASRYGMQEEFAKRQTQGIALDATGRTVLKPEPTPVAGSPTATDLLGGAAPTPIAAPTSRPAAVGAMGATLYESANGQSAALLPLKPGAQVEIVQTNGDWIEINYRGVTGWVAAPYLSQLRPAA